MSFLRNSDSQTLTVDTDLGRINSNPTMVILPTGRRVVFYNKTLTSGRTSASRVTFTGNSGDFNIYVSAGSGTLNGNTVTWPDSSIITPDSTFSIVYIDSTGTLMLTSVWDKSLITTAIILAFAHVGQTIIVSIEEIEKNNNFIFYQKQSFVGSTWVWDTSEYILNSGEQPRSFYDASLDQIFLTYRKDSHTYVRVFDTVFGSSWTYIENVKVQSQVIHIANDPQDSTFFSGSFGGDSSLPIADIDLYPLYGIAFAFFKNGTNIDTYIYLPYVGGSYLPYAKKPFYYEIFIKSGSSYTLVQTVPFSDFNVTPLRWSKWLFPVTTIYVGVAVNTTMFSYTYHTPTFGYLAINLYEPFDKKSVSGTTISDDARDYVYPFKGSFGDNSVIYKTSEIPVPVFIGSNKSDTDNFKGSFGNNSVIYKTAEYVIPVFISGIDSDTDNFKGSFGNNSIVTIS